MDNNDIDRIKDRLPFVFTEKEYKQVVRDFDEEVGLSEYRKRKLLNSIRNFQLKVTWNKIREKKFLCFDPSLVTIMDLLTSMHPRHFFSYHSALYFNELTDQRPEEYYLSREKVGQSATHTKGLDNIRIRQSFLKGHRKSSNFFTFRKIKSTLIDKQDLNRIGVISKKFNRPNEQFHNMDVFYTNIERTLIDCIISPQYAGGIKTVLMSFDEAKIDLEKLFNIYKAYDPIYPYWQSIGFALDFGKGSPASKTWRSFFDSPEREFYLDRNYRDDWAYNEKWKIYYPKGIDL